MADNGKPGGEVVRATIDGREVVVPEGTTILHAAEKVGIKIPHYCYHPGLSVPAQCRMCLVEVEGAPKLQPSCQAQLRDGAEVRTDSDDALKQRKGVLEFYLMNHPLDCPICDQSGECKLQDYVHAEGRKHGRSREPKRVFGRDDFGGDVLFYGDRCVMCTRCVRFMDEMADDPRLTVVERGDRAIIDTFFEEGLDGSPFHGNIVDICPVGALVSKDFLHKQRAWDLDHTPSICPNCSQGCNIDLHTRDERVQRLKPRENPHVNAWWMCDYGRHRYEWINRQDRVSAPVVRDGAGSKAPGWRRALEETARRLRELGEAGADVVAVGSVRHGNEDLAALAAVVKALGGGKKVFRSSRADEEIVLPGFRKLARRKDLGANRRGAEIVGFERVGDDDGTGGLEALEHEGGVILVLGDELEDVPDTFGDRADLVVYVGPYDSPAAARADVVLPATTFAEMEGTFTNFEGRVQRFFPALRARGMARPAWQSLRMVEDLVSEEGEETPAPPTNAGEAFARAAAEVPAFRGLTYETMGTRGAPVNEPAGIPTGTASG